MDERWEEIARELGDYELANIGSGYNPWREMKRVTGEHCVGHWVRAWAAGMRIAELEQRILNAAGIAGQQEARIVELERERDEAWGQVAAWRREGPGCEEPGCGLPGVHWCHHRQGGKGGAYCRQHRWVRDEATKEEHNDG